MEINNFTRKTFQTRGGRLGSGMGVLLEALWAYYIDQGRAATAVENDWWEVAWLPDHEYNDFACVEFDKPWDPATRTGELFRIEAKSMNSEADEPKGHFDELTQELGAHDLLLVLVWRWQDADRQRVFPAITDHFLGLARPIAELRDTLHLARGGTFVVRSNCPDGCRPADCPHHGEPLNADRKRERSSGPETCRPNKNAAANNFGGLLRMLHTRSAGAKTVFREQRSRDETHHFISFIHRHFPDEERNAYSTAQWREAADSLGVPVTGMSTDAVITAVRSQPSYMDTLRSIE